MVRRCAKELVYVKGRIICSIVLATLVIVSCSPNPVGEDENDLTEDVTISSDEQIVLSAVSAQLLSGGEPLTIQTNQGSATLRYQAPNDSLSELLELQTGENTITWFERRAAAPKRQARSNAASPQGTWNAFVQKIGNSVYALAAADGDGITIAIEANGDGLSITVSTVGTVNLDVETDEPARIMNEHASLPLEQRILGVWLGESDDKALWAWVRDNSISYAYPNGEHTVFVTVDYTLVDSILKGDEWEFIDDYTRVTKVWFSSDTLILDITNNVPDGFSPGPREIFRLVPYTGAFPPPGWQTMETSPEGPVLPEHSLHNTAWREIQDGQPQEDVLLFGDSLYFCCECWGEYSDCSSPEAFEQPSANYLRLYNWSGDDPYTDESYHISNDTLYLNSGQDYHMSTFIREHNPCGFDGENQLPTQPATAPGISVRHEEIIGTWNFSGGTAGEEGGFGMWLIDTALIWNCTRTGFVCTGDECTSIDTICNEESWDYTFDENSARILFGETSLQVELIDAQHMRVILPDNSYYLMERITAIGALSRLSLLDLSGNSLQNLSEEIVNQTTPLIPHFHTTGS